jgi:hypothetical protein
VGSVPQVGWTPEHPLVVTPTCWDAGRQDLQRSCRKRNLLVALGWSLLEFTWEDVHDRPDLVRESVRRVKRLAAVP